MPHPASFRRSLAIAGLFLLVFAAGEAALQHSLAQAPARRIPGDPGPFFLIGLCLWAVGAAGLWLLGLALWRWRAVRQRPQAGASRISSEGGGSQALPVGGLVLPAALVLTLIALPALLKALGTPLAVALFVMLWTGALAGLRYGRGQPLPVLATALGAGLGAWLVVEVVFLYLLSLALPR